MGLEGDIGDRKYLLSRVQQEQKTEAEKKTALDKITGDITKIFNKSGTVNQKSVGEAHKVVSGKTVKGEEKLAVFVQFLSKTGYLDKSENKISLVKAAIIETLRGKPTNKAKNVANLLNSLNVNMEREGVGILFNKINGGMDLAKKIGETGDFDLLQAYVENTDDGKKAHAAIEQYLEKVNPDEALDILNNNFNSYDIDKIKEGFKEHISSPPNE